MKCSYSIYVCAQSKVPIEKIPEYGSDFPPLYILPGIFTNYQNNKHVSNYTISWNIMFSHRYLKDLFDLEYQQVLTHLKYASTRLNRRLATARNHIVWKELLVSYQSFHSFKYDNKSVHRSFQKVIKQIFDTAWFRKTQYQMCTVPRPEKYYSGKGVTHKICPKRL